MKITFNYRGEVTFSLKTASGKCITLSRHNAAEIGIQLAFANMLTGISTSSFIPTYVLYGGTIYAITGRNKRISSGQSTRGNPKYYAEFNAFIPLKTAGSLDSMLSSSALYTICGAGYADSPSDTYMLASISPNIDPDQREEIKAAVGSDYAGMQLNINWKMYIDQGEEA